MPFRWVATPLGAGDDAGLAQWFPTQADAEAWLTGTYEELAEAGVSEVTLLEDDHVVYGPMSLHQ